MLRMETQDRVTDNPIRSSLIKDGIVLKLKAIETTIVVRKMVI